MSSFKKFKENKLPDRCKFFSSLKVVVSMNIKGLIMFGECLK